MITIVLIVADRRPGLVWFRILGATSMDGGFPQGYSPSFVPCQSLNEGNNVTVHSRPHTMLGHVYLNGYTPLLTAWLHSNTNQLNRDMNV